MTFAPVSISADDLATLERCVYALGRAGYSDEFTALGALTMRLRGSYFAALPTDELARRAPERFEHGPLRLLRGGAA